MDHRLLEIVACPVCNGKLWYNQEKQELICKLDNLAFPLRDGIPVLLETGARVLAADERKSGVLSSLFLPATPPRVCRVSRCRISTVSR